ncbi:MAG: hypothetical protein ACP5DC_00155 [Halothiobacillaceae bacterium]
MNPARLIGLVLALSLVVAGALYYEYVRGSAKGLAAMPVERPAANPALLRLEEDLVTASARVDLLDEAAREARLARRLGERTFLAQVPPEPEQEEEVLLAEEAEARAQAEAAAQAAAEAAPPPLPDPVLQMIFVAEQRARALIDGRFYRQGDELDAGGVVASIEPDEVTVERGSERLVLRMDGDSKIGRVHP